MLILPQSNPVEPGVSNTVDRDMPSRKRFTANPFHSLSISFFIMPFVVMAFCHPKLQAQEPLPDQFQYIRTSFDKFSRLFPKNVDLQSISFEQWRSLSTEYLSRKSQSSLNNNIFIRLDSVLELKDQAIHGTSTIVDSGNSLDAVNRLMQFWKTQAEVKSRPFMLEFVDFVQDRNQEKSDHKVASTSRISWKLTTDDNTDPNFLMFHLPSFDLCPGTLRIKLPQNQRPISNTGTWTTSETTAPDTLVWSYQGDTLPEELCIISKTTDDSNIAYRSFGFSNSYFSLKGHDCIGVWSSQVFTLPHVDSLSLQIPDNIIIDSLEVDGSPANFEYRKNSVSISILNIGQSSHLVNLHFHLRSRIEDKSYLPLLKFENGNMLSHQIRITNENKYLVYNITPDSTDSRIVTKATPNTDSTKILDFDVVEPMKSASLQLHLAPIKSDIRYEATCDIAFLNDTVECEFFLDLPSDFSLQDRMTINSSGGWVVKELRLLRTSNNQIINEHNIDIESNDNQIQIRLVYPDASQVSRRVSVKLSNSTSKSAGATILLPAFSLSSGNNLTIFWNIKSDSDIETMQLMKSSPVWFRNHENPNSNVSGRAKSTSEIKKPQLHNILSFITHSLLNSEQMKIVFIDKKARELKENTLILLPSSDADQLSQVGFYLKSAQSPPSFKNISVPEILSSNRDFSFELMPENAPIDKTKQLNSLDPSTDQIYIRFESITNEALLNSLRNLIKSGTYPDIVYLATTPKIIKPDSLLNNTRIKLWNQKNQSKVLNLVRKTYPYTMLPECRFAYLGQMNHEQDITKFLNSYQIEKITPNLNNHPHDIIPVSTEAFSTINNLVAAHTVKYRFSGQDNANHFYLQFPKDSIHHSFMADNVKIEPVSQSNNSEPDKYHCRGVIDTITINYEMPVKTDAPFFVLPNTNIIMREMQWNIHNNTRNDYEIAQMALDDTDGSVSTQLQMNSTNRIQVTIENQKTVFNLTPRLQSDRARGFISIMIPLFVLACLLIELSKAGRRIKIVNRYAVWLAVALTLTFVSDSLLKIYAISGIMAQLLSPLIRIRFKKTAAISSGLLLISLVCAAKPTLAQDNPETHTVPVIIPFEDFADIQSQPDHVFVSKKSYEAMKDFIDSQVHQTSRSYLIKTASHLLKDVSDTGFNLVSKYDFQIAETNKPLKIVMTKDEATSIKIKWNQEDIPLRFDPENNSLEIELNSAQKSGTLVIEKLFVLNRNPVDPITIQFLPSLKCDIISVNQLLYRDETVTLQNSTPGTEVTTSLPPLTDKVRLKLAHKQQNEEAAKDDRITTILGIDTGAGIKWIFYFGRLQSDSQKELIELPPDVFLSTDNPNQTRISSINSPQNKFYLFENNENSFSEIHLFQKYNSLNRYSLRSFLSAAPQVPKKARVLLATVNGIAPKWKLDTIAKTEPVPVNDLPITIHDDIDIVSQVEVADWKKMEFELTPEVINDTVLVQSRVRVTGDNLFCHFIIDIQRANPDSMKPEFAFCLPANMQVYSISSPDLISWHKTKSLNTLGRYLTTVQSHHKKRIQIEVHAVQTLTLPDKNNGQNNASSSPLPWPLLENQTYPAGRLLIEQEVSQNVIAWKSPLSVEGIAIRSLGEMREADTPTNIRRWYFQVNEHKTGLTGRWSVTQPYSKVTLSHRLELNPGELQWTCNVTYKSVQGPLGLILLKTDSTHNSQIIIDSEIFSPSEYEVTKIKDGDSDVISIKLLKSLAGEVTFRLSQRVPIGEIPEFAMPAVTPLGPGIVEKTVQLDANEYDFDYVASITSQGFVEEPRILSNNTDRIISRLWNVQNPTNSFLIQLRTKYEVQKLRRANWVVSNLMINHISPGRIVWSGDIVAQSSTIESIEWPAQFGTLVQIHENGNAIAFENQEGIIKLDQPVLTNRLSFISEVDHSSLHDLLSQVLSFRNSKSGTDLVIALKNADSDNYQSRLKKAQVIDWLIAGLSIENTTVVESDPNFAIKKATLVALYRNRFLKYLKIRPELQVIFEKQSDRLLFDETSNLQQVLNPVVVENDQSAKNLFCDLKIETDFEGWAFYTFSDLKSEPGFSQRVLSQDATQLKSSIQKAIVFLIVLLCGYYVNRYHLSE